MSRLDSFIRRLEAQRRCLDHAVALIGGRQGVVLELGLGNGRTYDHLCKLLPDHEVLAFERDPKPHPDSRPPDDRLVIGDMEHTLREQSKRLEGRVVLAHGDFGTGDARRNARVALVIAEVLPPLLAPDAIVVCDQMLPSSELQPIALPEGVLDGRYFLYRHRQPAYENAMGAGTS